MSSDLAVELRFATRARHPCLATWGMLAGKLEPERSYMANTCALCAWPQRMMVTETTGCEVLPGQSKQSPTASEWTLMLPLPLAWPGW